MQYVLLYALFSAACSCYLFSIFFFNDTATTEIYTLSLHDALPIYYRLVPDTPRFYMDYTGTGNTLNPVHPRSEEHTSELQSPDHLVCPLLLEKKKTKRQWHKRNRPSPRHPHNTHYNIPQQLLYLQN